MCATLESKPCWKGTAENTGDNAVCWMIYNYRIKTSFLISISLFLGHQTYYSLYPLFTKQKRFFPLY